MARHTRWNGPITCPICLGNDIDNPVGPALFGDSVTHARDHRYGKCWSDLQKHAAAAGSTLRPRALQRPNTQLNGSGCQIHPAWFDRRSLVLGGQHSAPQQRLCSSGNHLLPGQKGVMSRILCDPVCPGRDSASVRLQLVLSWAFDHRPAGMI